MRIVKSRAPYRISFAGGGSDLPAFYQKYGGAVVNATIDRFCYASIKMNENNIINFISVDQGIIDSFLFENISTKSISKLPLHLACFNYFLNLYGNNKQLSLDVLTFAEMPIGSGLGASSTLVVSLIKAFSEFFSIQLGPDEVSSIAFKIERIDCGFNGGKQDMYASAYGGINYFEFKPDDSVSVKNLHSTDNCEFIKSLESNLMLFYTNVSRESSKIIDSQSNFISKNSKTHLEALRNIKNEAKTIKESFLNSDFQSLVNSLNTGWELKKQTSDLITNNHINEIIDSALCSGAIAAKISGAGGGGFVFFIVELNSRSKLISALKNFIGTIYNIHFCFEPAVSWVEKE